MPVLTTSQDNLFITVDSSAQNDLILDTLEGQEWISKPYEWIVRFHGTNQSLDLISLVGKDIKIKLKFEVSKERYFTGIVGTIEQEHTINTTLEDEEYEVTFIAKIYPTFWKLKFSKDHKIFQNKSTIDIIKSVLSDQGVIRLQNHTNKCGTNIREYCVQYGESHFDFVCRLMEEEGIYYYFTHDAKGDTLVLADDSTSASTCLDEDLKYFKASNSTIDGNLAYICSYSEEVVSKKYTSRDYNYEPSSDNILSQEAEGEGEGLEVYSYPGIFKTMGEASEIVGHRIQELEWTKKRLFGSTTAPNLGTCQKFTLADHHRASLNAPYVAYYVSHSLSQVDLTYTYKNDFQAFPCDVPFRPPLITRKPRIHSHQTAIVTGPDGEEISCDNLGRITVKFHWDRSPTKDESSSCPIRVAQLWAGSNWGGLFTPRIGMEVVIAFENGDPDRPLVIGCVYNGTKTPPYVEDDPTKSTIKSQSSKDKPTGFNELRFTDKKDSEEIFIHAEKDLVEVIEDNETKTINLHHRTVTLEGKKDKDGKRQGDDKLTLKAGDRSVKLTSEDDKDHTHSLEITKGHNEIKLTKGNQTVTLSDGNETKSITGERSVSVTKDETHKSEKNYTHTVTDTYKVSAKKIELNAGSDGVEITSEGSVTIKGTNSITIKSETSTITIQCDAGALSAKGMSFEIKSTTTGDIKSTAPLTIKSDATIEVGASGTATFKADGMTTIKGAMVEVSGDGMAKIKGGIVMIN